MCIDGGPWLQRTNTLLVFLIYECTQEINVILLFSSRDLVVGSEDTVSVSETIESKKKQKRQHDPLSKGYHP